MIKAVSQHGGWGRVRVLKRCFCILLSLCLPHADLTCFVAQEFGRSKFLTQIGGAGFTKDNTILFSQIDMGDNKPRTKLQMLIPKALVGGGNKLGIRTECVRFEASAGNNGADSFARINKGEIDWSSWLNVKGTVQSTEPETLPNSTETAVS